MKKLLCAALLLLLAGPLAAGENPARPPLRLLDLQGHDTELALAPGERALVIHFWATWCPSCVAELPALDRAAAACGTNRVRVVAVNVGESAEAAGRYASEHALTLPILLDPLGEAWRGARFRELPANLVWRGIEIEAFPGPTDEAEWHIRLAELGCPGQGPGRPDEPADGVG